MSVITWKDIRLATLQKMFAADGSTITNDESTKDYLAGMPYAANEGLQLLSTAGKFIIKSIQIAHNPVPNLVPSSYRVTQILDGYYEVTGDNARSYYFEVSGKGSVDILVDGILNVTLPIDNKQGFTKMKGLIANPNGKKVKLAFRSTYPMALKNVALYSATWEYDEEVQDFAEKVKYNMKDLAEDFFMLESTDLYYEGNDNPYTQTQQFWQEGNTVLVLDRQMIGNFIIYYKAYPEQITIDTPDEYELPIDDEVAVLLPLYMASQLYKDDDNGIATSYRNEFEVAFERLKNKANAPSAGEFISKSGWI